MPYLELTAVRTTIPDIGTIARNVKSTIGNDCSAYSEDGIHFKFKKNTNFTAADITNLQSIINTAPSTNPQLTAQNIIDNMPIFEKAILLTLLDEINILRTNLGLAPRTVQQAITAVRNKAATL